MDKFRYERPLIKKLESSMPNKFGMRTEYSPKTHIDGVAVADLIDKYGSPVFVLSEKQFGIIYAKPAKLLKPAILKFSLPGRIKQIIWMPFVVLFIRRDHGLK